MAELTGASLFVDLPCGLSPRALKYARDGKNYLGLDLPLVIERIQASALPLIPEKRRSLVRFAAADATNPEALLRAVGTDGGEVCIVTEGLLMYFSRQETELLCEGIRQILAKRGGCWTTADPEMPLQIFLTLKAVSGEQFPEVLRQGFLRRPVPGGRQLPEQPSDPSLLQIQPRSDVKAQIAKAMDFLASCGLKAERMPLSVLLDGPILPDRFSASQCEALDEALRNTGCWIISPV